MAINKLGSDEVPVLDFSDLKNCDDVRMIER